MERPLGAVEQALWRLDRAAPINFTTVASVRGPLRASTLRAALATLQARHPALRTAIVSELDGAWFRATEEPLDLRMVEAAGRDDAWVREAEQELVDPFQVARGPLARCIWLRQAPEHHTLLLTLHHVIGDGMSGIYIMRDLISAAGSGVTAGLPLLAASVPIEGRFPARVRGVGGWWRRAGRVLSEGWRASRGGRPATVRYDQQVPPHTLRARAIHEHFDAAFVERLGARVRREDTTIHGALAAAMILGVLKDGGHACARVAFGSPVNLRGELVPQAGEELGCFASLVRYDARVDAGAGTWELARALRADLEAARRDGAALMNLSILPWTVNLFGGEKASPQALIAKWQETVPMTGVLTNLGRLPIATEFGTLTITGMHFLTAPCALGDFVSTATSLHGELVWNFVCPRPSLGEAHARALVADIVARLRKAVEEDATVSAALPSAPEPGTSSP
jgi:hypothetical protein